MAQYKANAVDFRNFILTANDVPLGELKYTKWHSYQADVLLSNHTKSQLVSKGIWNSTIELKEGNVSLLTYKMGLKGIIITTQINGLIEKYLFKLKDILGSKYVLLDADKKELLTVKAKYNLKKWRYDYIILTSDAFEELKIKDQFLLTILHSIIYHNNVMAAVV